MKIEDYFKYYIQGSEHYLIPKDVFDELFEEMSNWREEAKELKEKYLNAVADYETTMFEKEQLNSLVNSCQEELRRLNKQLEEINKMIRKCGFVNIEQVMLNYCGLLIQQKEFIEYMNKTIEELECDDVDDEEMKGYLIQRIYTFKEILSNYREIIGSDINVGSKGDKDE